MKTSFNTWRLSIWLLACLSVVQIAFGQFVLCIEDHGEVSVEIGLCACPSASNVASESISIGNAGAHQCGPCEDIILSIDTVRTTSQEHLLHHLLPIITTHPEAKIQYFDLVFAETYLSTPRYNSSLQSSISATILLI